MNRQKTNGITISCCCLWFIVPEDKWHYNYRRQMGALQMCDRVYAWLSYQESLRCDACSAGENLLQGGATTKEVLATAFRICIGAYKIDTGEMQLCLKPTARPRCLQSGHRWDAEPALLLCLVPFVAAGEGVEREVVVGGHWEPLMSSVTGSRGKTKRKKHAQSWTPSAVWGEGKQMWKMTFARLFLNVGIEAVCCS
jgi:hypothetical protein